MAIIPLWNGGINLDLVKMWHFLQSGSGGICVLWTHFLHLNVFKAINDICVAISGHYTSLKKLLQNGALLQNGLVKKTQIVITRFVIKFILHPFFEYIVFSICLGFWRNRIDTFKQTVPKKRHLVEFEFFITKSKFPQHIQILKHSFRISQNMWISIYFILRIDPKRFFDNF